MNRICIYCKKRIERETGGGYNARMGHFHKACFEKNVHPAVKPMLLVVDPFFDLSFLKSYSKFVLAAVVFVWLFLFALIMATAVFTKMDLLFPAFLFGVAFPLVILPLIYAVYKHYEEQ